MPLYTCDVQPYNEFALELPVKNPDGSYAGGYVLVDCRYTWDGVSPFGACNGPVIYLRTRNTGPVTQWALLPDKKKPPLYVAINPGTDVTITAQGQLNNLGLSQALDVQSVTLTHVNPA